MSELLVPPFAIARVALDLPLADGFDYTLTSGQAGRVRVGAWALVPWGDKRLIGIVTELPAQSDIPPERLRPVIDLIDDAPCLPVDWLEFIRFIAHYYHRAFGEVAMPALPKLLRTPPGAAGRGSVFSRARRRPLPVGLADNPAPARARHAGLTDAQQSALQALNTADGFQVHLLHGITGSGKTEVYLRWFERILNDTPQAQVLLLVPEIALTPQLSGQIAARFPAETVLMLHSDLPDGERATQWLAAVEGRARLLVGTRLAVLTPMPALKAIVVDEEHDPSYKQQEGVRYSARDLAIALAARRGIPVVLGSATPSLESWYAAARGRYRLLTLPARAGVGALPVLYVVDPRGRALRHGLGPEVVDALAATLARGEQSLVFINRRGFAPVLCCEACGWLSRCDHCTAFKVLHRGERRSGPGRLSYRLVCHHCASEVQVPRACPDCGNVDLSPVGRGTQRLEDGLRDLFPQARVARLDRDVARRRHAARELIAATHAGEIDMLIGTQMLAKGHDFQNLSLVVVVDADGGLYSSDFRAPERLFAVLMQVAGRAGRGGAASRVIVQTRFPGHPLFAALGRHDYQSFANAQLAERRQAGLPPFAFQALLRAQARNLDAALAFLADARALAAPADGVVVLDPVPMPMMRLAGQERAQLLIESHSRPLLHAFLDVWLEAIATIRTRVRWQLEVDPQEI